MWYNIFSTRDGSYVSEFHSDNPDFDVEIWCINRDFDLNDYYYEVCTNQA